MAEGKLEEANIRVLTHVIGHDADGKWGRAAIDLHDGATPAMLFTFSTSTSDADPGAGRVAGNNAGIGSVTMLFFDLAEAGGADVTAWIEAMDDSTSLSTRGFVRIVDYLDPVKFVDFAVSGAVVTASGYRKVPVAYVAGPGGFADGAKIAIGFARTGDKGDAGASGSGTGDVIGPAGATNNAFVMFDGTSGTAIKEAPYAPENPANKGAVSGYAPLDGSSQVPATHLTAYAPKNNPVFTGAVTLPGDPVSALQPATKQYVDGVAVNMGKRSRVRAATTASVTISTALNAGDALDGVTLGSGDLVLVKNQGTAAQNGVYVVGATPVRAADFDVYSEFPGSLIAVAEGTANADTLWLCTSNDGGTIDSTAIAFSKLTTQGELLAANNLSDVASASAARTNLGLDALLADKADLVGAQPTFQNLRWTQSRVVPNGEDCDTYLTGGFWICGSWNNGPVATLYGQLHVYPTSISNDVLQVMSAHVTSRQWRRFRVGGTWGAWVEIGSGWPVLAETTISTAVAYVEHTVDFSTYAFALTIAENVSGDSGGYHRAGLYDSGGSNLDYHQSGLSIANGNCTSAAVFWSKYGFMGSGGPGDASSFATAEKIRFYLSGSGNLDSGHIVTFGIKP